MRSVIAALTLLMIAVLASGMIYEEALAVGAPSENFSTPEAPLSDNATPEIKPPNFTLLRPTEQSQTAQPSFNCAFVSRGSGGPDIVTGNEEWEILIDINMPGWLYIYEYYPSGIATPEQWVAYKWQPGQSGVWQIGPFIPAASEPPGKHVYRIWFFAEGRWASTDNQKIHYRDLEWTYIKESKIIPPISPVPSPSTPLPATPAKQDSSDSSLYKIITNPIFLLISPSLIVVIIILIRYFISRAAGRKPIPELIPASVNGKAVKAAEPPARVTKKAAEATVREQSLQKVSEEAPTPFSARLVLPGDLIIKLNQREVLIGRADLARVLELDQLGLISRKHFKITFDQDSFFIEDSGSANGTSLNGRPVAGQGPVKLNDGDIIEPADAVRLKFQEI